MIIPTLSHQLFNSRCEYTSTFPPMYILQIIVIARDDKVWLILKGRESSKLAIEWIIVETSSSLINHNYSNHLNLNKYKVQSLQNFLHYGIYEVNSKSKKLNEKCLVAVDGPLFPKSWSWVWRKSLATSGEEPTKVRMDPRQRDMRGICFIDRASNAWWGSCHELG